MRVATVLAALFLLAGTWEDGLAASLTGRVLRVESGDRFVLVDRTKAQYRIQLTGIHALPPTQPLGALALEQLTRQAAGRFAIVEWDGTRSAGVLHGTLRVGDRDLALDLLIAGLARLDPGQLGRLPPRRRLQYEQAEREARSHRRGIWGSVRTRDPVRPAPSEIDAGGQR